MRRSVALGSLLALVVTGSAFGFQQLPTGGQVNNDPAAGIDPSRGASGEQPANSDLVGGALTAGNVAVPWAILRQQTSAHDQIFARSFADGLWTTRGSGTVGGRSDTARPFPGSLNFDQGEDGEAPAIDFAGAGRTVPWATWYEDTATFGGAANIFASRFDNTGDSNQGKWIFGGQARDTAGGVLIPSLNIHTSEAAENPAIAGGSATDPTMPGPWVTWQETDAAPVKGRNQIFAVRPLGPGQANCDGVTPVGKSVGGHVPSVGGFCWQQVGVPRVGTGATDPSLNVDPTRDGLEPDIAFSGANDGVPWIVWYETGPSKLGLSTNGLVFAAKGVSDGVGANGGFHWVAVGSAAQGTLDTSDSCAASTTAEAGCSLNQDPSSDAEDPRVAAGTMDPSTPTVPWVAWDEQVGGVKQVFVSRLVGTGSTAHFELANGGAPISGGTGDSTRPDITFSGHTPYISWREDFGGLSGERALLGHFTGSPAAPTFVLDDASVPLTPPSQADVREPISSSCTGTPFNQDGASCQGGALGTPFFLFTNETGPIGLFAGTYQPGVVSTAAAGAVTTSGAVLNGTVDPAGASVNVFFQYGPTTAYGQTTGVQSSGPVDGATRFSATLSGLAPATTIHYRTVAVSDFGTFTGADQALTTASPPQPKPRPPPPVFPGSGKPTVKRAKVSGATASVSASCAGRPRDTCALKLQLSVVETFRGDELLAIAARPAPGSNTRRVVFGLGGATRTLYGGRTKTIQVSLGHTAKLLLAVHHPLFVKLQVIQKLGGRSTRSISTQTLKFKVAAMRNRRLHAAAFDFALRWG